MKQPDSIQMMSKTRFALWVISLVTAFFIGLADKASASMVPEGVVAISASGGIPHAVLVDKKKQRFMIYAFDNGARQVFSANCSTGENSGPKLMEGDKKTPEGVYFFTSHHGEKELSPIYGTRAFPMDYPTIVDVWMGKTGNAIWLHGTNKPLKPMDSNGCVALENKDIDFAAQFITLNRTPIIIADEIRYVSAAEAAIKEKQLSGFLENWRVAYQSKTYHDFLNLYDSSYLPDISWWPEWQSYLQKSQAAGIQPQLMVSDLSIFRADHVYVLLFSMGLKTDQNRLPVGQKKLFVKENAGRFRIIGDAYQTVSKPEHLRKRQVDVIEDPLLAQFRIPLPEDTEHHQINRLVKDWLTAWSSKNIKAYGQFYDSGFQSQGMNLTQWLNHKKALNRQYDYIRVSQKDLKISGTGDTRTVTFLQIYESNRFKTVGQKRLTLKRVAGEWKIFRETFRDR